MRKFFLVLLLFAGFAAVAQNENKKKIKGSGNMVTKNVSIQPFTELKVSGVFSVMLEQGSKEEVRIEADDNLLEMFEVKNEGNMLVIDMKDGIDIESRKGMKVYVSFKNLKKMVLATVGNIKSQENLSFSDLDLRNHSVGNVDLDMSVQSLDLDNASVGNMKLSGKAENAVMKNNSVGNLSASDFVVQKLDIDNNGIGSAEVNAQKEIKVKDSFLGKVKNKGKAEVKKKVTI